MMHITISIKQLPYYISGKQGTDLPQATTSF